MPKDKLPRLDKPERRRELRDAEKAQWEQIAGSAKVMDKREKAAAPPPKPIKKMKLRDSAPIPPTRGGSQKVSLGSYADIDHRTAEKFRTGANPIDATLDLHFMTRDEADKALTKFIHRCWRQQKRFLLIITGKGREDHAAVLKPAVRQWLTGEELAPFILAVDQAQAKDGGSGAYYVLLRRDRAKS